MISPRLLFAVVLGYFALAVTLPLVRLRRLAGSFGLILFNRSVDPIARLTAMGFALCAADALVWTLAYVAVGPDPNCWCGNAVLVGGRRGWSNYQYFPKVFVLPPWKVIYENDAERDHTFEHAESVNRIAQAWSRRCGYRIVEVPMVSVDERCTFVLQALATRDPRR